MIVDTHAHVWWPQDGHRVLIRERVPSLDTDFRFERLLPDLDPAGVGSVVLVSAAQSFAETQRLLDTAARFPARVAGVIGFLDMRAPDFEDRLAAACLHKAFKGLRLPLVVFEDADWIRDKRVGRALAALAARGLVAQVLAGPQHLSACADVLADHPDLKAVIDHAGNPGAQELDEGPWRQGLAAVGRRTRALCKVGNFALPAGPLPDRERHDWILAHVVASFGWDRLLYGSNWPVSTLQQTYADVLAQLHATAKQLGLDAQALDRATTANARRIFGLGA